jgi:hypothetical protein
MDVIDWICHNSDGMILLLKLAQWSNQVDESTRAIIFLILIMVLLLALAFLGSNFMMRRAVKAVIKMFRLGQALSPETARTAEELGFKRKSILQFKAFRDYKPSAMNVLIRADVIQTTEDGRVFLSEDRLMQTNLEKKLGG